VRTPWLLPGLFCVTFATLMLEVLDSRLLSVLAWYHLSFLAISVAMLGMAAGAVLVFIGGDRRSVLTPAALPGLTGAFAIVIALAHLGNLAIPFPPVRVVSFPDLITLAGAVAVLTLPFVLSGVVVTLALTRTGAPIGRLYGADLLGAALGCLGVMGLLNATDITSAAFVTAGAAGVGAWCFARAAGRKGLALLGLAVVLFAAGWANAHAESRLGVLYPKNRSVWPLLDTVEHAVWNSHSYVMVRRPEPSRAWLWGPGKRAPDTPATVAWAMIDGEAGTPITAWNGDPASLDWVKFDVTTLPYLLRHGRVGVIGVGGGRDLLTAIWAGNRDITGIEVNRTFIELLEGPYRAFAGVAGHPGVRLVNDEARSFLTRSTTPFDILQMSLIDTWASTGAGAFTLTENGLYTREGWRVFLRALAPDGVLSVSRWYAPEAISETTRLVSLGAAALLDAGVEMPASHLILASADNVATLMISPEPFSDADRVTLRRAATDAGFDIQASPWTAPADDRMRRVVRAVSMSRLHEAAADPAFDFTPPTDARPFFFNMLKLRGVLRGAQPPAGGGVITGNLVATSTLLALLGIAGVLVLAIIGWPLLALGRPAVPTRAFVSGLAYFALIGSGFMFLQIPFLQRFSVYLGHPTYTFSIILFLMIVAAGGGSFFSERLNLEHTGRLQALVLGIAGLIAVEAVVLSFAMEHTVGWGLPGRTAVVAAFVVPLAAALGVCFPVGMRLIGCHSQQVTAWMWGVNGACGVLASILAVMVSLWLGIQTNLWIAAVLYALLAWPIGKLGTDDRRPDLTNVVRS
jgi:hypothetical protein